MNVCVRWSGWLNWLLALSVLTGLCSCSEPEPGPVLRIGVIGGPENLDPHSASRAPHVDLMLQSYEALIAMDASLRPQPALATSWRRLDELHWEFQLRGGVRFHDGSLFSADDVVFSLARIKKVSTSPSLSQVAALIDESVATDPLTVRLKTRLPTPALPTLLPRLLVVSSSAARQVPGRSDAVPGLADDPLTTGLVGTGPFRLISWEPRGAVVLERHEVYWRGPSHWRTVIRLELPDDAARAANLRAGQVDLINNVSTADFVALRQDPETHAFSTLGSGVMMLYLDQRASSPGVSDLNGQPLEPNPLTDPRVREAIDLAIDRQAIAEVVFEGLAEPAALVAPANAFGSIPDAPFPPADPIRARQLLANAGFPAGFRLELLCARGRVAGDAEQCQALGRMLTAVGIRTDVEAVPGAVYYPRSTRREFSAAVHAFNTVTGEAGYAVAGLLHTRDPELDLGGSHKVAYSNPALDELIGEALVTFDEERREQLLQQILRTGRSDRAVIPLVSLSVAWATPAKGVRYTPRTDGYTLAYEISPGS